MWGGHRWSAVLEPKAHLQLLVLILCIQPKHQLVDHVLQGVNFAPEGLHLRSIEKQSSAALCCRH